MKRLIAWLRQHLWPPRQTFDDRPLETSLTNFAEAEDLIARFGSGEQANLQDLLDACAICQVEYYDILWDHNNPQQHHRPSAA